MKYLQEKKFNKEAQIKEQMNDRYNIYKLVNNN